MGADVSEQQSYFDLHVFCCTNKRPDDHKRGSCAARGGVKLRNYMKVRAKELGLKNVRINSAGCLDRCELGPAVVVYPDGTWYNAQTLDDIEEILTKHILEGGRAERLMLAPDE